MPSNGTAKGSEATDIGSLWEKAVNDYYEKTGRNLSHMKAQNMSEVLKVTESGMQSFQGFRHKGDKVDKVRSAFGRHLDGMQKCMAGIMVVGAAAGAFPPAMPVGIVFAACGHLLSAFAGVKADYDRVEDFFNHSSRFYERLSIIENKDCDAGGLEKAIVRVFSTQLSICAIVEAMTNEKGARFKQWLNALWNMQDQDLAAAYSVMQKSIEELAETVGYASYAEIKSTHNLAVTISDKADRIDESIKRYRAEQSQDVLMIYESNLEMKSIMTAGFKRTHTLLIHQAEQQAERDARILEQQAIFNAHLAKVMQAEKNRPEHQDKDRRKQTGKVSGKGDVGDKKFQALRSIKNVFDANGELFSNWRDAHRENILQNEKMTESFVDSTGDWLSHEPAFEQWIEGKSQLLWIHGSEGMGKSFLAHATLRRLSMNGDADISFAYFYFKEDFPYLQSVQNAFASAALQVAESNTRYAEQIAAKLKEDGDKFAEISTWHRFFFSTFPELSQTSSMSLSSDKPLYLVFDGLDEAHEQQRQVFRQFLTDLRGEKSKVHVMVTSRSEEVRTIRELDPLIIEVTKEKMMHDIRALIWNRLSTFGRLRKFSFTARRVIRRKVARHADGMLYVDHMLRRLSYIGREGAVLKDLEKMPKDLHALYRLMLDECRRNRSVEQYDALKKLFAWLAFSKRSLSLAEASELVNLTITRDDFDIEDEIIGRSARILELSRTSFLDEDHKDDAKEDDNDDQGDEHEADLDEYRKSSLTFQERSLRQYFRAVSVDFHGETELRTPASSAHLTILAMCTDILINSARRSEREEGSELRNYAIKYWYEHLTELDVDAASDAEVGQVLGLLYRITNNESNVAKLFERYAEHTELYPSRDEDAPIPWFDRLRSWAVKGACQSESNLSAHIRAWVVETAASPDGILIPLAKSHMRNWIAEPTQWYIFEAFRFAKATLKLSGRFQAFKDEPLKEILSVADAFEKSARDAKTTRAIGTTLFYASYECDEEDRQKQVRSEAMTFLEQSLETTESDSWEKGHTLLLLANVYSNLENFEDAVSILDKALYQFSEARSDPSDNQRTKEIKDTLQSIYIDKAQYLRNLDRKDDALDMFNEARILAGEEAIGAYYLDDITILLDEATDPDGHRFMTALKGWSQKERCSWFGWCLQYWADLPALGRMFRAAKLTAETTLVLEWLNAYGKTLAPRSLILFNLKAALADLHNRVLGDVDKAKEATHAALEIQPKVEGIEEDVMNERISEVRMDLAGIIFSQFRASCVPQRKEALLEEMKSLPGMRTDNEFRESHIGMLVANMLRIMGPAREYQDYMDQIFKTCTNGLEDNVSWNDGSSLRLLAKVLSSLTGLERDARIAISAQFSILDRGVYDNESRSKSASESGDGAASSKHENTGQDTAVVEVGVVQEEAPAHTSSDVQINLEMSVKDALGTGQSTSTSKNGGTGQSPDHLEVNVDEDISEFTVGCDGNCGKAIQKWSETMYLCLICPNTDLCVECHDTRQAWNHGEVETPWKSFCAKNHHYIKGPMKGWKGIKNGIIRIEDEELTVKEWIKGLKEERWPKAWNDYWLRQGGLKDIGAE